MTVELRRGVHGASGIELLKVTPHGDRDDIHDLVVDIELEGEFTDAYGGDGERSILSAESLSAAVFALAPNHAGGEPEEFALALTHHLVLDDAAIERARVRVVMRPWERAVLGDRPRGRTFLGGGNACREAVAVRTRVSVHVEAGVTGLEVLWSDAPAFGGRRAGTYPPAHDSALTVVTIDARWRYGWPEVPYAVQWRQCRAALIASLTEQRFPTLQAAAYGTAEAIITQVPAVASVHITLAATQHARIEDASLGVAPDAGVYGPRAGTAERVEAELSRNDAEG